MRLRTESFITVHINPEQEDCWV